MQSDKIIYVHYDLTWIRDFVKNNDSLQKEKIIKNVVQTENSQYTIVRYDKKILSYDLVDTYGLIRSVIFDKNNKIIGFSPPKSMATEFFIQKYPDLYYSSFPLSESKWNDSKIAEKFSFMRVEEFIEGTMINVFWDETIGLSGAWEISTRNTVGANISFYQNNKNKKGKSSNFKTFRQMFLEAMKQCYLSFDDLIIGYSYSFVLQHPENRIVVPFTKPNLYLVGIYQCIDYSKYTIEQQSELEKKNIFINSNDLYGSNRILVYPIDYNTIYYNSSLKNTQIQLPKQLSYSEISYSELINKYASMNTPYYIMGVVIKNLMTGERCKIRNPVYEQVRELKGNQAKLQYQYLTLRNSGKIKDYLRYYPEHKKDFSEFRDHVHLFTTTLYENYVNCFIKKTDTDIKSYPKQYQHHMISLHQRFLNELRDEKKSITLQLVISYINEMHPSKLMFSINYHLRQRNIELQKVEDN